MAAGVGEALDSAWNVIAEMTAVQSTYPDVFSITLLVVVGFVGGRLMSDVMLRLLRMTRLDEIGVKSDIQMVLRKFSYRGSLSMFIADVLKWLVYLITVFALFDMFGSTLATSYSEQALVWMSQLVGAMLVLIVGVLVSERIGDIVVQIFRVGSISGRVDESHAELPLYTIAGRMVKMLGYTVAVMLTLGFIGVDPVLLNIFTGVFVLGVVAAILIASWSMLRNIAISMYFQTSRIFRGGETVRIGEYEGRIDSIRPLYTEIKKDGNTYYIPNTRLVSEVIEYKGE